MMIEKIQYAPVAGPEAHQESEEHPGEVAVAEGRPRLKRPPKYAVVLLNDDYTAMEFVVEVLRKYFDKNGDEAIQIMLCIHKQGRGVAGVYTFEIAETKVYQVQEYARSQGFPLKCIMEELSDEKN